MKDEELGDLFRELLERLNTIERNIVELKTKNKPTIEEIEEAGAQLRAFIGSQPPKKPWPPWIFACIALAVGGAVFAIGATVGGMFVKVFGL